MILDIKLDILDIKLDIKLDTKGAFASFFMERSNGLYE